jgi:4-carboxymuconolactone decarboxylase
MPRLQPIDLDALTPEQRAVADAIIFGPRGGLRGPFEAWLRSPGMAQPAQELGAYCRFGSSLPAHLSELAILLTGKHWKAQFEFWAHSRLATAAGLAPEVIEAIRTGQRPALDDPAAQTIYDFVTEYFATSRVTDATYRRAVDAFGEAGVVDLVGTVGYYGLVSMTLNVFEVSVPPGETEPLS